MQVERILAQHGLQFSSDQQEALSADRRPTLLLAVPGSGKTTTLVSHTAYLLESGVLPDQICSLTFSRESARDMEQRFSDLFGELFPQSPRFSTIHSLCWRILNDFSIQFHRSPPQLMTGSENAPHSASFIRQCAEMILPIVPDEETISELAAKIGLCKNRLLSKEEIAEMDSLPEHFLSIFSLYEEQKKQQHLMDYDDLLLFTLEILEKRPAFCSQWQNRYLYWNIDEGQDLSPVQFSLLKTLCPDGNGLLLVGDEDQSIYGFRGADPGVLLQFPQYFPGARILKMEENHRSRPEILHLCENFIRQMPDRYDKRLIPTRMEGGKIEQILPKSMADTYAALDSLIQEMPSDQSVGILYRSNLTACSLSVYLREQQIPFRLEAEPITLLYSYPRTIAALLAVCGNLYDLDSFHLAGCRRDIGSLLYENIFLRADGSKSIPQLLRIAAERLPRKWNALELADALEQGSALSPQRALHLLETKSQPGRTAFARWKSGDPLLRMRYTQLRWLCETSPDYPTLFHRLSQAESPSAFLPEAARVTLSTIHSAKGLEFDSVILLDCFDGILPAQSALTAFQKGEPADFREEQRLFYVAATRAKDRLVLLEPPQNLPSLHLSRFAHSFLLSAKNLPSIPPFQPGDRVQHRFFGTGVISKRSGDIAEILFEKFGEKSISMSHCIQNKIIFKIN
ncbi:MAG: ATP-dependent helicase [Candidatus Merdivicinus sp.]